MEKFYSIKEAANLIDCSERTIQRLMDRKKLDAYKTKGRWAITGASLNNLLETTPKYAKKAEVTRARKAAVIDLEQPLSLGSVQDVLETFVKNGSSKEVINCDIIQLNLQKKLIDIIIELLELRRKWVNNLKGGDY